MFLLYLEEAGADCNDLFGRQGANEIARLIMRIILVRPREDVVICHISSVVACRIDRSRNAVRTSSAFHKRTPSYMVPRLNSISGHGSRTIFSTTSKTQPPAVRRYRAAARLWLSTIR